MRRRRDAAFLLGRSLQKVAEDESLPELLLQAVVECSESTDDGQLIEAVAVPWFEIVRLITKMPEAVYEIPWRKWEEIIAGAYEREGYRVILTPRSGDDGRDVIAERTGVGSIRIVDQVKAYGPRHLVTADEVRAMLGVLEADRNVSKGVITTTSEFAPEVSHNGKLAAFMPYRLELKPRSVLLPWLQMIAQQRSRGR
jgi:restriction system protein